MVRQSVSLASLSVYARTACPPARAGLADIADLEGGQTYARNLPGLDKAVREVIAMIEDLSEGAESGLKIEYEYHTGSQQVDRMMAWLRTQRERIRREAHDHAPYDTPPSAAEPCLPWSTASLAPTPPTLRNQSPLVCCSAADHLGA